MMKIVIAGSNGFAQYLAHYLETTTAHQFVILSRRANPGLTIKGWQVISTDYSSTGELTYLLTGVDVVFSTITGTSQMSLINAAAAANVRTFVPSEFCNSPSARAFDDVTDTDRSAALARLQFLATQTGMNYTVFTCGLFYERFGPGGPATSQIDVNKNLGAEGEFLVDIRGCLAKVPAMSDFAATAVAASSSLPDDNTYLCLTSARDAARYIVAALSLPTWPLELKFRGQRLSLQEIVAACERVRGLPFQTRTYSISSINDTIEEARQANDTARVQQFLQLRYTLEGRFDFTDTNLDSMVHVVCETFAEWLQAAWEPILTAS